MHVGVDKNTTRTQSRMHLNRVQTHKERNKKETRRSFVLHSVSLALISKEQKNEALKGATFLAVARLTIVTATVLTAI